MVAAGKRRSKLRRRLLACISPARAAAVKAAERAAGAAAVVDPVERYPVPYTLAVSTVDKLTLELDFCADDVAGGARRMTFTQPLHVDLFAGGLLPDNSAGHCMKDISGLLCCVLVVERSQRIFGVRHSLPCSVVPSRTVQ